MLKWLRHILAQSSEMLCHTCIAWRQEQRWTHLKNQHWWSHKFQLLINKHFHAYAQPYIYILKEPSTSPNIIWICNDPVTRQKALVCRKEQIMDTDEILTNCFLYAISTSLFNATCSRALQIDHIILNRART